MFPVLIYLFTYYIFFLFNSAWGEGFFLAVQTAIVAALVLFYGTAPPKGKRALRWACLFNCSTFQIVFGIRQRRQTRWQCRSCPVFPRLLYRRRCAPAQPTSSDSTSVDFPGFHRAHHHHIKGELVSFTEEILSS